MVHAPAALLATSPVAEAAPARAPGATYPSLVATCDAAEALMRKTLGIAVTRTAPATFSDEFAHEERTGCRLGASGSFRESGEDPASALANAFRSTGWLDALGYGADGPDGSVVGLHSREALCIIEFQWDGGDDADPSYVPADWFRAIVSCALSAAGDPTPD